MSQPVNYGLSLELQDMTESAAKPEGRSMSGEQWCASVFLPWGGEPRANSSDLLSPTFLRIFCGSDTSPRDADDALTSKANHHVPNQVVSSMREDTSPSALKQPTPSTCTPAMSQAPSSAPTPRIMATSPVTEHVDPSLGPFATVQSTNCMPVNLTTSQLAVLSLQVSETPTQAVLSRSLQATVTTSIPSLNGVDGAASVRKCDCCKNRYTPISDKQKFCAPCKRKEVIEGQEFVECSLCGVPMRKGSLLKHHNQKHGGLPPAGKDLGVLPGRRCSKCNTLRPTDYFPGSSLCTDVSCHHCHDKLTTPRRSDSPLEEFDASAAAPSVDAHARQQQRSPEEVISRTTKRARRVVASPYVTLPATASSSPSSSPSPSHTQHHQVLALTPVGADTTVTPLQALLNFSVASALAETTILKLAAEALVQALQKDPNTPFLNPETRDLIQRLRGMVGVGADSAGLIP